MIIFSLNLSKAKKGSKYKPVIKKNIIPKVIKPEIILNLLVRHAGVKVKIFDKPKNIVKEFSTITEAAKYLSVSNKIVHNIIKTGISYDDYIYKFKATIGQLIIVVNNKNNLY